MIKLSILALALVSTIAATLKYDAPAGWISKTPTSKAHFAEFTLPKATSDSEDASLIIYFFATGGGGVQANIDRWIGQIQQPNGKPSKDVAKTTSLESHGLKISLVDVSGTFTAEMTPGAGDNVNKPGFRLLAAVVETTGGPYYVKLTGPQKTVAKWNDSFRSFLKSLRME